MRSLVKKFRAKLGDDAQSPIWTFSVPGVSYRMASPSRGIKGWSIAGGTHIEPESSG